MSWTLYSQMQLYGDFLSCNYKVKPFELLQEIKQFDNLWQKYNPYKPEIKRDALAVTSFDGTNDPINFGSLKDITKATGKNLYEEDFKHFTTVYDNSPILQDMLKCWKPWLNRTQFIRLPQGGHFPPHIDGGTFRIPTSFRIVFPLQNVNPPDFCWMYGDDQNYFPLQWELGRMYYLNTNKRHWLFNASAIDSIWLVCNITTCEESVIEWRKRISL